MDIKTLQRVVVDALEDVKAQDIVVFNTTALSDLFDRVILASGTSNRQTRALASRVAEKVKETGGIVVSIEGEESGEWVLVDLGDAVVHVMQPAVRAYYGLEEIWGGKPVRMKLAGATASDAGTRARSSAKGDGKGTEKPTVVTGSKAGKKAASKTDSELGNHPTTEKPKKAPVRRSAAGTGGAATKTISKPRKTASRKTTTATTAEKRTSTRTSVRTSPPSSSVPAKKTAVTKSPAKRAAKKTASHV